MTTPLVPDDLWDAIAPLLPLEPPKTKGGRPLVPDRAALGGILFVLRAGIGWEALPHELGCGSGMTCWPRLRDWQDAGVWGGLHRALLDRIGAEGKIDWSRAAVDSASVRAKGGARERGPTRPTAASPTPSATCSSTAAAFRWPRCCRRPTATTRCSSSRSSAPCRPPAPRRAGGARGRPSATPTRATMTGSAARTAARRVVEDLVRNLAS